MTLAPSDSSTSIASVNLVITPAWYPSPDRSVTTPIRKPATSPCRAADTTGGTGASIEVESIGSCPDIASCSRAASSTVRPNGPGVSSEEAKATTP